MNDTLRSKITTRIMRSREGTFVPADFFNLSDRDQVLRVLRRLIQEKLILRVGQGVYTRAKISTVTNKCVPEQNIREIAVTVLRKSGVRVLPTRYEREYREGKVTQVPTGLVIGVNKRVNKRIGFNGRYVKYEKVTSD